MMKTDPNLYKKIESLLPHLDLDLFTGILCIRHASRIPRFSERAARAAPQKSLWDVVKEAGPGDRLSAVIDALHQIAPRFPWLNSLADSIQSAEAEESALGDMIALLSDEECGRISLSRIYEYRLRQESWETAGQSGDFYTPSSLVRMMTKLLEITKGSVYDPCCGSGAMLQQALLKHRELKFYGQTADRSSYQICLTNACLHGQQINLGGKFADVFAEDLHARRKFDYILTNLPFNVSNWGESSRPDDPRWRYGIPPQSNANFAWLQHIISHLAPHGRAAVILPNGALTTGVRAEQHIRRRILCAGLVEAVIALPPRLFYTTAVPCSLWLIDQAGDPEANVLLVDARHLQLGGTTEASTQNIAQIESLVLRHRAGKTVGKTDWYAAVPLSELAPHDYNLSPNLYTKTVRISAEEIRSHHPRFVKTMELLAGRIEDPGLSASIQQWRSAAPSSHWESTPLLELYEASGGITKPKECFGHGIAMVDLKAVIHNLFLPEVLTASVAADKCEIQKYQIKAGDLLLNRTSETIEQLACGCIAPQDRRAVYSAYVKRLRPIHKSALNPLYMAGYLRSAIYRQEVKKVSTVYTTRANINLGQLSNIAVYFPEPAMQRRLGETLFAVSQFQGKNGAPEELLREFIALLIEQYITYPVLCIQNREE